ncbi:LysR substrate-binding domain-containing protein [Massilia aquatica]|uniref:LysR family transcriptional regulator n=1 Tax=Massilia aquatica TaxID=2609000 RepID=A0ABX0M7R6_9BURK|nr:LysR substrate-binding domain-containing protein [Massilia aquatica]NHZ40201.1 LysR family transcriptional regulator [Massilia aquatica]
MRLLNFDLDTLRTFAAGIDLGSYAKAAAQLGRSTSAVSAQLKKLEDQAGAVLFRKAGRGLALTDAGTTLLAYARRLLDINDEAALALRSASLAGEVRLGLQEDVGEALLAQVLGQFIRSHPNARIEVCVARSAELQRRVAAGQLDLAITWDTAPDALAGERLATLPLHWIGPAGFDPLLGAAGQPLPLVLLEAPCALRDIAAEAMDRAGIRWRCALSSASLSALWAASAAGLGMTIRTRIGLPSTLALLDPVAGRLPALPSISLAMHRLAGDENALSTLLAELLRQAVRELAGPARQQLCTVGPVSECQT